MAELAIHYRQYAPSRLEPLVPARSRQLEDLALDLATKTGKLTHGLHPIVVQSLGILVRSMNCY